MADKILLEDNSSILLIEDGTSALLLETDTTTPPVRLVGGVPVKGALVNQGLVG